MALEVLGPEWNISEKGAEIITENNTIKDKATILKNALNSDFKEIGAPFLNKVQSKSNVSQVVLQIQKVRNVAAPKANENSHVAPRMLKLILTDGDAYIQAIETASVPSLTVDKTPPGSKILIRSAKLSSGYILLDSNNCSLLGGRVPALYEKWELAKSVQYHNRQNSSSDGPPAWVNFGCKFQSDVQDKSFKSLDNKSQESKENSKFDLQRQDAIAEATSGAVKKVFGGGSKQPVQQTYAPRSKPDFQYKERKNNRNKLPITEVEDKPQKPSERVSLFDFLEDKLPPNESNNAAQVLENTKPPVNRNYVKNVQSYPQNNKNYNYGYNQTRFPNHQNNRMRNDFKPQPPTRIENDVNGLSNNFDKMSLNTQFASRSLKQHLNLGPQKKNSVENTANTEWKAGDDCVAIYWEDGKFYNASITAVTDRTCVVKFKGYGNVEEVLKSDCMPAVGREAQQRPQHSGPMEFRRSSRTYRRQ